MEQILVKVAQILFPVNFDNKPWLALILLLYTFRVTILQSGKGTKAEKIPSGDFANLNAFALKKY